MLVLGLGSNLDNPLDNLRCAVHLLKKSGHFTSIKISPLYQSDALLPANAPANWNKAFLNLAIRCKTALSPDETLLAIKKIEQTMGRNVHERWSPRVIDIDILAWDNLVYTSNNLTIPHAELINRPFALWPLLDLMPDWKHPTKNISITLEQWGSRYRGESIFNTKQISHRIETPALIGILNITADSFSDGGNYNSPEKALSQAKKLFDDGAEIIDIGAESTRPGAVPKSAEDEWKSLHPVLQTICDYFYNQNFRPKISIDTYHYAVAEKALNNFNIDWINDVTGFSDTNMCNIAANNSKVKCVVMHNLGIPANKEIVLTEEQDYCEQLLTWAQHRIDKLIAANIKHEQLIFDVGIGFGKNANQSLTLLKNINKFRQLNLPLLVGHSRKSFFNLLTDKKFSERDLETAILSTYLAQQHIDYLRVHNVEMNARALKAIEALNN